MSFLLSFHILPILLPRDASGKRSKKCKLWNCWRHFTSSPYTNCDPRVKTALCFIYTACHWSINTKTINLLISSTNRIYNTSWQSGVSGEHRQLNLVQVFNITVNIINFTAHFRVAETDISIFPGAAKYVSELHNTDNVVFRLLSTFEFCLLQRCKRREVIA